MICQNPLGLFSNNYFVVLIMLTFISFGIISLKKDKMPSMLTFSNTSLICVEKNLTRTKAPHSTRKC